MRGERGDQIDGPFSEFRQSFRQALLVAVFAHMDSDVVRISARSSGNSPLPSSARDLKDVAQQNAHGCTSFFLLRPRLVAAGRQAVS